ncbi:acyl-CoA-binding protein [Dactylosporangium sp. NPDC005555]|uniref:acyl-CoA-binding protein n=1 Tax=Dactylosporangium sp. NPDC005555 TaxID=3154889 RepID=UPI0033AEDD5E
MSLAADFEQAQTDVKQLPSRPANNVLLRLYALYKQGTHGDADGKRPGVFDLVGRAKYDAWKSVAGTAREDAQRQYVALVTDLRA